MSRYVHFKKVSAQDVGHILGCVEVARGHVDALKRSGDLDSSYSFLIESSLDCLDAIVERLESGEYYTEKVAGDDDRA